MLSAALACHRARATTPLRRLPSSRSSRRHPHRDTAKDWRRRPRQWSPFCLVAVLESCTPQLAMSTIGTGLSRGEEGGAWAHCAGTSAAGWAVALLPAGPSGPVRATIRRASALQGASEHWVGIRGASKGYALAGLKRNLAINKFRRFANSSAILSLQSCFLNYFLFIVLARAPPFYPNYNSALCLPRLIPHPFTSHFGTLGSLPFLSTKHRSLDRPRGSAFFALAPPPLYSRRIEAPLLRLDLPLHPVPITVTHSPPAHESLRAVPLVRCSDYDPSPVREPGPGSPRRPFLSSCSLASLT